jgi:predicted glutamine amidotransferase
VAWREDGEVRWMKGLEPDELETLIAGLPGEIVIHFRIASVGEVTPRLCHPFPVTVCATTRLSGHARAVLFHNGTWSQWRETLRRMPRHRRPDGLLSDTRVAASLVVRVCAHGRCRSFRSMQNSSTKFLCQVSRFVMINVTFQNMTK